VAGAHVVLAGAEPIVYVEKGGRGLLTLVDAADARLPAALEALAGFVLGGRGRKLALEKIDGEPVVGSDLEPLLIELGFRQGPRKLTLSA
jgi:ATP-dependent Lhr-like helicase